MVVKQLRKKYYAMTTIGEVSINGVHYCYSLEDTVRADGIKVYGDTAIPAGVYELRVTFSPRFKRNMVEIVTPGKDCIEHCGIVFEGVRVHGGNDHKDTHGCPLYASKRFKNKIQASMEKDFTALVQKNLDAGEKCELHIFNGFQYK